MEPLHHTAGQPANLGCRVQGRLVGDAVLAELQKRVRVSWAKKGRKKL